MRINYVEGDLFAAIKGVQGGVIIPHVCNNIGAWGAGFVIPLGRNFPSARDEYLKWAKSDDGTFRLGEIQTVQIDSVCVVNMVAQNGVGPPRPLKYPALGKCVMSVRDYIKSHFIGSIHAPMFGAGLAGGDWNFIEQMIYDGWVSFGIPVTVYYLPGTLPTNWKLPA
jgi:O-acetyl-ADP-ribose deacetylase (regulator of RNase III)